MSRRKCTGATWPSGALELEDAIDYSKFFSFAPPDLLKSFPPAKVIDAMRVRLDADKAADTHLVVGFQFRDPQDACALEIRRGVAVFHDQLPEHTDAMIATTSGVIHQRLGGQTTPADALQAGDITITGDTATAQHFFTYFEPPSKDPIKLVVR